MDTKARSRQTSSFCRCSFPDGDFRTSTLIDMYAESRSVFARRERITTQRSWTRTCSADSGCCAAAAAAAAVRCSSGLAVTSCGGTAPGSGGSAVRPRGGGGTSRDGLMMALGATNCAPLVETCGSSERHVHRSVQHTALTATESTRDRLALQVFLTTTCKHLLTTALCDVRTDLSSGSTPDLHRTNCQAKWHPQTHFLGPFLHNITAPPQLQLAEPR